MQEILQWLHREEFLEDIAKLKSSDVGAGTQAELYM